MKAIIIIVLVLLITLFIYQKNKQSSPTEEDLRLPNTTESLKDQSPKIEQQETEDSSVAIKNDLDIKLKQQIAETKTELDSLMLEYNDNLKNQEKRKQLESKITLLLDQYNQLILPSALEKVKEGDNPPS